MNLGMVSLQQQIDRHRSPWNVVFVASTGIDADRSVAVATTPRDLSLQWQRVHRLSLQRYYPKAVLLQRQAGRRLSVQRQASDDSDDRGSVSLQRQVELYWCITIQNSNILILLWLCMSYLLPKASIEFLYPSWSRGSAFYMYILYYTDSYIPRRAYGVITLWQL